ncbi:multiple epidermal growth factor-like domains protein 11 isoform X2 [Haliotis rubra]|nr:multiple epidermal growth factor-like domains protein 11 isoform X2 [Haliotis rubra]
MDGQDMCHEGWFGPYCQTRNIALMRSCSQSSTLDGNATNYGAGLGVDGRATTNALSLPRTCAHTKNESNPTWTVNLNTPVPEKIQHIRLYLRDRLQERSNGMEILVGSQMCYNWSSTEHPPPLANVTCRQPLTGTTVTIRIPGPLKFLTLCEVQIFVCSNGWFSEDCDKQCRCLNSTDVCDKITGHCSSGCLPGYYGTDCQTACPDGYYGLACGFQCGNCVDGDVCIKTNGTCPGGCAARWFSDRCDQPCPDGRYGANCASPCGHCLDTDVCDKVTGKCPGGCQPGWWPDYCSQVCLLVVFDIFTACSDGRHGHHCQTECGQCKGNLPCNKINGTCDQGCQTEFQEPFCKDCVDGMYGDDCTSRCGQCKDGLNCDKSSGECPEGCQGNFIKPLCQGCPATSGYSNQVVPVAATLGTLLVLSLIALLTSIVYNRRLKIQLDASQKKPGDNYLSLDENTKDPVVESTYEQIDNTIPYINAVEVNLN